MPLVDPVTMSSAAASPSKASSVSGKPTEPSQLQPVHLHSTPASRAARHVFPVAIAALFLAGFGHLVADPVPTMWASLPVVALLQITYAVLCLPMAGSGGAGKNKKQRPGEKKKAGDASGPNLVIVRTPSPPPSPLLAFCWLPLRADASSRRPPSSPSCSR